MNIDDIIASQRVDAGNANIAQNIGENADTYARDLGTANALGVSVDTYRQNVNAFNARISQEAIDLANAGPVMQEFFADRERQALIANEPDEYERLGYLEGTFAAFKDGMDIGDVNDIQADLLRQRERVKDPVAAVMNDVANSDLDDETRAKFENSFRSIYFNSLQQDELREMGKQAQELALLMQRPVRVQAPKEVEEISNAKDWQSMRDAFLKDPLAVLGYTGGSSMGQQWLPLIASVPAYAMSKPLGAAVAAMGGGHMEYQASLREYAQEELGYDFTDPKQVMAFINNAEHLAAADKFASARHDGVVFWDFVAGLIAPLDFQLLTGSRALGRQIGRAITGRTTIPLKRNRVSNVISAIGAKSPYVSKIDSILSQAIVGGVLGAAGEYTAQQNAGQETNWGDVFLEAVGEFFTMPVEAGFAHVGVAMNHIKQRQRAAIAAKVPQVIADLAKVAAASTLRTRSPEEFKATVQKMSGDGAMKEVYVKPGDLSQSARTVIAAISPEVAQAMEKAEAEGGVATIPMADLLTALTNDESVIKELSQHVRVKQDGMSAVEAEKWMKDNQDFLQRHFQEVYRAQVAKKEFREELKTALAPLAEQLKQAHRDTLGKRRIEEGKTEEEAFKESDELTRKGIRLFEMQTAHIATMAGMTPSQFVARYPIYVQAVFNKFKDNSLGQQGLSNNTHTLADEARQRQMDTDAEFVDWKPNVTSTGKIPGAPEWVTNRGQYNKLLNLLRKFIMEGVSGRFWYEDSGESILRMCRGDLSKAEKACQLIAIYSAHTAVGTNTSNAMRTLTHWLNGGDEAELHAATGEQDKKARNVLYHDVPWDGRKTNSFYLNLMYQIVKGREEEARNAGIDVDAIMEGKSTIDMWMLRAFGYEVDAATDDKVQGKYSFSENVTRKLTAELNRELLAVNPNANLWTPHQVQAAIWTSIKVRYEMQSVKDATNAQALKQGLATLDGNKMKYNKDAASEKKHYANWRKNALKVSSEEVIAAANELGRSFDDEIIRTTYVVTAESIPSPTFKSPLLGASHEVKRWFTQDVEQEIFKTEDGADILSLKLGVPVHYLEEGMGMYQGDVSPNTLSRVLVVPAHAKGTEKSDLPRMVARIIQLARQYVTRQNAVPFIRIENKTLNKQEQEAVKYHLRFDTGGKSIKRVPRSYFETKQEAEAYKEYLKTVRYTVEPMTVEGKTVYKIVDRDVDILEKSRAVGLSKKDAQAKYDAITQTIPTDVVQTKDGWRTVYMEDGKAKPVGKKFKTEEEARADLAEKQSRVIEVKSFKREGKRVYNVYVDGKPQVNEKFPVTFESSEEAQKKADAMSDEINSQAPLIKVGRDSSLAKSAVLHFSNEITPEQAKVIGNALYAQGINGYTKLTANSIVVTNFVGSDNMPFDFDYDSDFIAAIEGANLDGLSDNSLVDFVTTWVDSEYGHDHDWAADPEGKEILTKLEKAYADYQRINEEQPETRAGSNPERFTSYASLDGWVRNGQLHFDETVKRYESTLEQKERDAEAFRMQARLRDGTGRENVRGPDQKSSELNQLIGTRGASRLFGIRAQIRQSLAWLGEKTGIVSREKIYKHLRMERGADGEWRFEIPDSDIAHNYENVGDGFTTTLGDILKDGPLFKAYPRFAAIPVVFDMSYDGLGEFDGKQIKVNPKAIDEVIKLEGSSESLNRRIHKTILHEVQHAIQLVEDHTFGASPEANEAAFTAIAKYLGIKKFKRNDKGELIADEDGNWPGAKELTDYFLNNKELPKNLKYRVDYVLEATGLDSMAEVIFNYHPYARYRRTAGEVEAFNVEDRMDIPWDERGLISSTEKDFMGNKLPRDKQLLAEKGFDDIEMFDSGLVDNSNQMKASLEKALEQAAWHGSPHTFSEFNLDFIGSGEGAQVHGWGLYFAKDRRVAEDYRGRLTNDANQILEILGVTVDPDSQQGDLTGLGIAIDAIKWAMTLPDGSFDTSPITPNAISSIQAEAESMLEEYREDNTDLSNEIDEALEIIAKLKPEDIQYRTNGRVFKVNIPEDEVMLDEQKIFNEQPEVVQKAISEIFGNPDEKRTARQIAEYAYEQARRDPYDQRLLDGDKRDEAVALLEAFVMEAMGFDKKLRVKELEARGIAMAQQLGYWQPRIYKAVGSVLEGAMKNVEYDLGLIKSGAERYGKYYDYRNMNGRELYDKLSARLGGDKQASLKLNELGVKGITYEGRMDGRCFVIFDDKAIEILEYMQKQDGDQRRATYNPSERITRLFKMADESSFVHESAHYWLETMAELAREILARPVDDRTPGEQAIIDTLDGFLKWLGQSGESAEARIQGWLAAPLDARRNMHEQFARGYEAYLRRGKAPTSGLRKVFEAFTAWLKRIYSDASELDVEMSDEVAALYDRLFMAEAEAESVKKDQHIISIFPSARAAGMSDEEFAALQEEYKAVQNAIEASIRANREKNHRMLRSRFEREKRNLQGEYEKLVNKHRKALVKDPVYVAWKVLTEPFEENGATFYNKLSLAEVRRTANEDTAIVDAIQAKGLITNIGQRFIPVQVLADMVGAKNAKQLLVDLADALPMEEEVVERAEAEFMQKYGNLPDDDGLGRAALMALAAHDPAFSNVLEKEYNALAKLTGGKKLVNEGARMYATKQVGEVPVKNLMPLAHARAEARAGQDAQKAFNDGDLVSAAIHKRNQVVQHHIARAGYEARAEIAKGLTYVKKVLKSKTIWGSYMEQIENLAARYRLANIEYNSQAKDLEKFIEEEEVGTDFDEFITNRKDPHYEVHYSELTVDEFREVIDTIKCLEKLGRDKDTVIKDGQRQKIAEVVSEINESIAKNATEQGRKLEQKWEKNVPSEQRRSGLLRFFYQHTKIAAFARIMDGDTYGALWNFLIRRANECGDKETEMRAKLTNVMREILAPVIAMGGMHTDKVVLPGTNRPLTREERIAFALNWGNDGNRQRLKDGFNIDDQQAEVILRSLSEVEWRAVEKIWQVFETLRPQMEALEVRLYGRAPRWIEYGPFEVTTKEGRVIQVSGGYYPAVYDTDANERSQKHQDMKAAEGLMNKAVRAVATDRSHMKKRSENVDRPISLRLSNAFDALNNEVHDICWREFVIDTQKVMNNGVAETISGYYDPDVRRQFRDWLSDIAMGDQRPREGIESMMSHIRQGVGLAGLGFNVVSAIAQLTGLAASATRLGSYVGVGVNQYVRNPIGITKEVCEASLFMKNRGLTRFRELNEVNALIRSADKKVEQYMDKMRNGGYLLLLKVQQVVDTVTWLGAYQQAIDNGESVEKARAIADQVVIDTQGSGMTKDLAAFERGGPAMKMLTVFYAFMNNAFNLNVTAFFGDRNRYRAAAKILTMSVVMPALEGLLRAAIPVVVSDDDDDDEITAKMLKAAGDVTSFNLGLLVGIRELQGLANAVSGGQVWNYSGPAGFRLFSDAYKATTQVMQWEFDAALAKSLVNLGGSLFGLPAAQINRAITAGVAYSEGDIDELEALRGALFGVSMK